MIRRGDIVLLSFPFTDLGYSKIRPALVISSEEFHKTGEDAIFIFITTAEYSTPFDFHITQSHSDFGLTGLKTSSTFRVSKIMCLEKKIIQRHLGKISSSIINEISLRLKKLLDI